MRNFHFNKENIWQSSATSLFPSFSALVASCFLSWWPLYQCLCKNAFEHRYKTIEKKAVHTFFTRNSKRLANWWQLAARHVSLTICWKLDYFPAAAASVSSLQHVNQTPSTDGHVSRGRSSIFLVYCYNESRWKRRMVCVVGWRKPEPVRL